MYGKISNGIHKLTGEKYDLDGFDVYGFSSFGINKFTGTKLDKLGYDREGLNRYGELEHYTGNMDITFTFDTGIPLLL